MAPPDTTPVLDAEGVPVDIGDLDPETARMVFGGRVRARCGHYMAKSERDAGLTTCERCPAITDPDPAEQDDSDTAEELAEVLRHIADRHPDQPVHFQLPNGEDYVLDATAEAYTHHGVIVVPIVRVDS